MNFHDIQFRNIKGELIDFNSFKGKVCMVVNIASHCTYTPQMKDLQQLYLAYKEKGFEVLAFPSNDFGDQEPLDNSEIEYFCRHDYNATFTVFEKSNVKGNKANPVFKFLRRQLWFNILSRPRWNFYKYLVTREGKVKGYFHFFTKPLERRVTRKIEKLL